MTVARTVLVTGAGSGIGAAICRRVAAPGIRLLVHTGTRRERAEAVAAECTAKGALCRVETGDLADAATPRRLVAAASQHLGELDDAGFERSLSVIATDYNVKEIELASRLGAIMPPPLQKSLFGESGSDANERR